MFFFFSGRLVFSITLVALFLIETKENKNEKFLFCLFFVRADRFEAKNFDGMNREELLYQLEVASQDNEQLLQQLSSEWKFKKKKFLPSLLFCLSTRNVSISVIDHRRYKKIIEHRDKSIELNLMNSMIIPRMSQKVFKEIDEIGNIQCFMRMRISSEISRFCVENNFDDDFERLTVLNNRKVLSFLIQLVLSKLFSWL